MQIGTNFVTFAKNNHDKTIQRRLMHGDIKTFTEMLSTSLEKEFINPKKMFEIVCSKYQFELLLLHDLSRENMYIKIAKALLFIYKIFFLKLLYRTLQHKNASKH